MERLSAGGIQIEYKPNVSGQEVLEIIHSFEVMVIRSKFNVDQPFFEKAKKLKLIARAGAGLDNINLLAAEQSGVEVIHAAEGNTDAVAEHTLGMILNLLSKISLADRSLKHGLWNREKFRGTELSSKTVGLLGYGNMGRAVARRLQSFGCKVLAYDKYLVNWPDNHAERVDFETLKKESDILSLHIPLTEETLFWVDKNFLSSCKEGLVFINTSRGKIVRTADLDEMLASGRVSAAGLDVFEEEPVLKKHEKFPSKFGNLFSRDEVLLTPHVAGWSLESYEKISQVLASKILHWFGLQKMKYGPKWV
jgi:D-3-phosphoglycerate dehydrogenase